MLLSEDVWLCRILCRILCRGGGGGSWGCEGVAFPLNPQSFPRQPLGVPSGSLKLAAPASSHLGPGAEALSPLQRAQRSGWEVLGCGLSSEFGFGEFGILRNCEIRSFFLPTVPCQGTLEGCPPCPLPWMGFGPMNPRRSKAERSTSRYAQRTHAPCGQQRQYHPKPSLAEFSEGPSCTAQLRTAGHPTVRLQPLGRGPAELRVGR